MNSLLIDFGNTYIKSAVIKDDKLIYFPLNMPCLSTPITKQFIKDVFKKKLELNKIDKIYFCCQQGGEVKEDGFYSWKQDNEFNKNVPLKDFIKECFDIPTIYCGIDSHLAFLGSHYKIINSMICVNIGTGSQVMALDKDYNVIMKPYIPAGRFYFMHIDKWKEIKSIKEPKTWEEALLRSFIYQYIPIIEEIESEGKTFITFAGSIPKLIPLIKDVLIDKTGLSDLYYSDNEKMSETLIALYKLAALEYKEDNGNIFKYINKIREEITNEENRGRDI